MSLFDRLQGDAPRYGWAPDAHEAFWNAAETARRTEYRRDLRRIGVVGAGVAGVHMAWLLRRRGFRNITILERNDYVGGKVLTLREGGLQHEMGACYTSPDYRQVRALLSEFGLYDRVPIAGRNVIGPDGSEQEFGDWVGQQLRNQLSGLYGEVPRLGVAVFVLRDIWRYNRIHRSISGRYEGALPPRPSQRGLQELRGTFLQFLERHELHTLVPILRLFQSAQGYGYIEEVPAFYGLLWNNPRKMKVVIEQLSGRSGRAGVDLTRAGMQSLVTEMVRRASLDVRLHTEVVRIDRGPAIRVRTRDRRTSDVLEHDFDLLFVAAPARAALDWFVRPTPRERELFGNQRSYQFTTTLQRGRQPQRRNLDSWLYRVTPEHQHEVVTQRLSRAFLDPEGLARQPPDEPDLRVVYQFGGDPITPEALRERYDRTFSGPPLGIAVEEHEIVDRRIWEGYFPHWDEAGILAGNPWEVLGMQGVNRTYWLGGSVCFESLRDIVDYNLLVVAQHFDR